LSGGNSNCGSLLPGALAHLRPHRHDQVWETIFPDHPSALARALGEPLADVDPGADNGDEIHVGGVKLRSLRPTLGQRFNAFNNTLVSMLWAEPALTATRRDRVTIHVDQTMKIDERCGANCRITGVGMHRNDIGTNG
jgi:hypothetical protein